MRPYQLGPIVLHFTYLQAQIANLVEQSIILGGVFRKAGLRFTDFALILGSFVDDDRRHGFLYHPFAMIGARGSAGGIARIFVFHDDDG